MKNCKKYRFEIFRNLIKQYQPKVIVCFGIGQVSRRLFMECFQETNINRKPKEFSSKAYMPKKYIKLEYDASTTKKIPVYILPFLTSAFGMGWNKVVARKFAAWGQSQAWDLS